MDRELWAYIVGAVDRALRLVPRVGRRPVFGDRLIVRMLLWLVWHDRNLTWACDRSHYGTPFRPKALPSISRFARRVKTDRVQAVLQLVHHDLATRGTSCPFDLLTYVDGKPLLVGPVSKDPDAKRGKTCGGFAKGYKFHAVVNERRRVLAWCITPLNTDEKLVAAEMAGHLPAGAARGDGPAALAFSAALTLGDRNYDSANLHRAFEAQGRCLFTPLRGTRFVGEAGRAPETLAGMGPARRAVIDAWAANPRLCERVLSARNNVEGTFSVMSLACGLDRLPGSVRRLPRVRRWAGCKVILYHARLLAQESMKKRAA